MKGMNGPDHGDRGGKPTVAGIGNGATGWRRERRSSARSQADEPPCNLEDEADVCEMNEQVADPQPGSPQPVEGVADCERQIHERATVVGPADIAGRPEDATKWPEAADRFVVADR